MSKNVLITTKNALKLDVVKSMFELFGYDYSYECEKFDGSVQQPFGYIHGTRHSFICAVERTTQAIEYITQKDLSVNLIVSVENGIVEDGGVYYDICDCVIYDTDKKMYYTTFGAYYTDLRPVSIPKDIFAEAMSKGSTCGEIFKQRYGWDSANWMAHYGVDRSIQIKNAVEIVLNLLEPTTFYRVVMDFPKKGIMFKDYNKLYTDGNLSWVVSRIINLIGNIFKFQLPEHLVVAGPELRGCLMAAPLACHLSIPFIPIRKVKKLPPPVNSVSYGTEYSTDTLEIASDLKFSNGTICILLDDIIATGGSIKAASQLCRSIGLTITDAIVLDKVDNYVPPSLDFNVHVLADS